MYLVLFVGIKFELMQDVVIGFCQKKGFYYWISCCIVDYKSMNLSFTNS